MTPEEALKHLQLLANVNDNYTGDDDCAEIIEQALTEHEKQKQILEVLKEHFVNRDNDTSGLYFEKHIGYYEPYYQIKLKDGIKLTFTETEFNLIKEWLK